MILVTSNFNPIALRKAKIVYNFGLSECNRVKKKRKLSYLEALSYCLDMQMYIFDLSTLSGEAIPHYCPF